MNFQRHENCPSCSVGDIKEQHNYDVKYCRLGRLEHLTTLPEKDQIRALVVEERFPIAMASQVVGLAKEKRMSILEILRDEKLLTN